MELLIGKFGGSISVLDLIVRIVSSIIVGTIIGFERERKNRPAGLRTHVLVCMAACLIAIVEQQMVYEVSNLESAYVNISIGRLSVGVISGIGFIGAGTIMMSKSRIVGLTTAASLWCAACLGLVDGMGYSLIAVISSVAVVVVLLVLRIGERTSLNRVIEVEFIDEDETILNIEDLLFRSKVKQHDSSVSYRKEKDVKICTARYSIIFKDNNEIKEIMSKLSDIDNVTTVKVQNVM